MPLPKKKYLKIHPWHDVREIVLQKFKGSSGDEGENEELVTIPYGPQLIDVIRHSNPVRCLAVVKIPWGEAYVTNHGSGAGNQINIWTRRATTGNTALQKLKLKPQICLLTYVQKHRVFIGFCATHMTEMSIRVFADPKHKFGELSRTSVSKTVLAMGYNEDLDQLVTGGQGFIQQWQLGTKEVREESLKEGPIIPIELTANEWVLDIRVDKPRQQLLVVCDRGVYVLNYKLMVVSHYFPNKHETALTCCTFYPPREYFITAAMDGSIKVWNMILFYKVHDFRGHYHPISGMQVVSKDALLITASINGTIRMWSLETLELYLRLDTQEHILQIQLANPSELMYRTKNDIKIMRLNLFTSMFTFVQSKIHKLTRAYFPRKCVRIVAPAVDGGIRFISPVTGEILTIIYPMNTKETWTVYSYNCRGSRLYAAMTNGSVIVFDCSKNPSMPDMVLKPESPDEAILSITLVTLEVYLEEEYKQEGAVFVGHKNGQISLLDARYVSMTGTVQAHTGQVVLMESCRDRSNGHKFASIGTDECIKVWSVNVEEDQEHVSLHLIHNLSRQPVPVHLVLYNDLIAFADPNNCNILMYVLEGEKKYSVLKHSTEDSHTRTITAIDICPKLGIIASTADDGLLKIWNLKNRVIREMTFDSSLQGVCFANERGDILVGFHNHIFVATIQDYLPSKYLSAALEHNFVDDQYEEAINFDLASAVSLDIEYVPIYPTDIDIRRQLIIPPDSTITTDSDVMSEEPVYHRRRRAQIFYRTLADSYRRKSMAQGASDEIQKPKTLFELLQEEMIMEKVNQEMKMSPRRVPKHNVGVDTEESEEFLCTSGLSLSPISSEKLAIDPNNILTDEEFKILQKKFPIAPDGYVPNSIIRKVIGWKPPTPPPVKKKSKKFDFSKYATYLGGISEGVEYEEDTFDDFYGTTSEPFYWDEVEDEETYSSEEEESSPSELPTFSKRKEEKKPGMKYPPKSKKFALDMPHHDEIPSADYDLDVWKRKPSKAKPPPPFKLKQKNATNMFGGFDDITEGDVDIGDDGAGAENASERRLKNVLNKINKEFWYRPPKGTELNVENAIDYMLQIVQKVSPKIHKDIMVYIRQLHNEKALTPDRIKEIKEILLQQITHDDSTVRGSVVRGFADLDIDEKNVVLKIMEALSDAAKPVRNEASRAVKKLAKIDNKDKLLKYLNRTGFLRAGDSRKNERKVLDSIAEKLELEMKEAEPDRLPGWLDEWVEVVDPSLGVTGDKEAPPYEETVKEKSTTGKSKKKDKRVERKEGGGISQARQRFEAARERKDMLEKAGITEETTGEEVDGRRKSIKRETMVKLPRKREITTTKGTAGGIEARLKKARVRKPKEITKVEGKTSPPSGPPPSAEVPHLADNKLAADDKEAFEIAQLKLDGEATEDGKVIGDGSVEQQPFKLPALRWTSVNVIGSHTASMKTITEASLKNISEGGLIKQSMKVGTETSLLTETSGIADSEKLPAISHDLIEGYDSDTRSVSFGPGPGSQVWDETVKCRKIPDYLTSGDSGYMGGSSLVLTQDINPQGSSLLQAAARQWRAVLKHAKAVRENELSRVGKLKIHEKGTVLPPINCLKDNKHVLLPAREGIRLVYTVSFANLKSDGQPVTRQYFIRPRPGKLSVHIDNENTGTSNFGVVHLNWTTFLPWFELNDNGPPSRALFALPPAEPSCKFKKNSRTKSTPEARPNTTSSFVGPVAIDSDRSGQTFVSSQGSSYRWEAPLPPAPDRKSRLSLGSLKDCHRYYSSRYHEEKYKTFKKRQGSKVQLFQPTIRLRKLSANLYDRLPPIKVQQLLD